MQFAAKVLQQVATLGTRLISSGIFYKYPNREYYNFLTMCV